MREAGLQVRLCHIVCHAARCAMAPWRARCGQAGSRIPDVPDDIRAMMEAMGGAIEMDEYR
jgi:hypothetical protein